MAGRLKNINRALVTEAVRSFAASLAPGARVLDVGAGSGHYRPLFAGRDYLAVDRGYEQQDRRGLSLVADIGAIPLADGTVDHALCMEVLEHLRDPLPVLREIRRVVRPGGDVLVSTPLCLGEHMQPYDFQRYTRYALDAMFVEAGFVVLSIRPRGGFFTLLAYLLARVPDELLRQRRGVVRHFKPLLRLLTTYSLTPLFLGLDRLDQRQEFTLGFVCRLRRP